MDKVPPLLTQAFLLQILQYVTHMWLNMLNSELTSLGATLTLWLLQSVEDHEFQRYLYSIILTKYLINILLNKFITIEWYDHFLVMFIACISAFKKLQITSLKHDWKIAIVLGLLTVWKLFLISNASFL